MSQKLLSLFVLTGALFFISACMPDISSTPAPATSEPLPPTVTPDPKLGIVKGVLQLKSGNTSQPVANVLLYLAEMKLDASGQEIAGAMDRITSPRAGTAADGSFRFSNVAAGRYVLVLDRIQASYMLRNPKDGSNLILTVPAGGEVDLGALLFDQLPPG